MASSSSPANPLHPTSVLGAYCGALVAGKRVALLGDGTTGLPEQLGEASRRRVHVFDPDPARVAARISALGEPRGAGVGYAVLDDAAELHGGAFDVVVVPELLLGRSPAELLTQARALLAGHGILLVASRNPRATHDLGEDPPTVRREPSAGSPAAGSDERATLGYYELYDLLSAHFPEIRMLGQAPFVGFTIADFAAEGEPAVTIDTSLMEGSEEPTWFVALASQRPLRVDPYVLLQVPLSDAHGWLVDRAAAADAAESALLKVAAERERALLGELSGIQEKLRREAEVAEQRRAFGATASARAAELEQQLRAAETRVKAMELRCAELEQGASAGASHEIGQLQVTAAHAEARVAVLEEQLRAAQAREAALRREPTERDASLRREMTDRETALRREHEQREAALRREHEQREAALRRELQELEGREQDLEAALTDSMEREADLESTLEQLRSAREPVERSSAAASGAGAAGGTIDDAPSRGAEPRPELLRTLEFQVSELRKALDAARGERDRMQAELGRAATLRTELAAARSTITDLEARLRTAQGGALSPDDADAQVRELTELEDRLRERGQWIAELEARLREAQRTGRELLAELAARTERDAGADAARLGSAEPDEADTLDRDRAAQAPADSPAAAAPVAAATGAETPAAPVDLVPAEIANRLRQQIEHQAQRCSTHQADLEAARWTIAALRHELAQAASAERPSDQQQLEEALAAAQRELSSLRAKLRELELSQGQAG